MSRSLSSHDDAGDRGGPPVVRVRFNGDECELPAGATVAAALQIRGFDRRGVAVELNQQVVTREQRGSQVLVDGDVMEVVSLIGGG